jgi:DNA-binding transcriptional MerR regulator
MHEGLHLCGGQAAVLIGIQCRLGDVQVLRREEVKLYSLRARRGPRDRYDKAAVVRRNFIRHARFLGFEMADIRKLLTLAEQPDRSCAEADEIARRDM